MVPVSVALLTLRGLQILPPFAHHQWALLLLPPQGLGCVEQPVGGMSVCDSPKLTNKTFIYANSLVLALSRLFRFLVSSRASQIILAHSVLIS